MELIINKLYLYQIIISITWFITHFEPITTYLLTRQVNKITSGIVTILTCFHCLSFWMSIILITFIDINIIDALTISMITYFISKNNINNI